MTTAVSISNLALSHIGSRATVTSIATPTSVEAELCAQFLPHARRQLLDMFDFSFAVKRAALADYSLVVTLPGQWACVYKYPDDCINALAVLDPARVYDEDQNDYEFELGDDTDETRVIYTNVPEAVLRYTFDTENYSRYSPTAVLAVSHFLAAMIAGPIIKGSEGKKVAEAELAVGMDYANIAGAKDANQRRRTRMRDDDRRKAPWLRERSAPRTVPDGYILRDS